MSAKLSNHSLTVPESDKKKKLLKLITVLALFTVILFVRLYHLEADPPLGLSISTDVYTDPAQYTYFAKMQETTGELNPFDDHRFTFFLKSTVTVAAIVVYKIFGVGIWQSNAVGLFYSFGSLLLFFLFIFRVFGFRASIFFLLLIGLNYNQIFYGRLPFLEHAMSFYAFLSLVLLTYLENKIGYLLAGLSLGLAIFFSKVIGLIFLFPFVCYLFYKYRFESAAEESVLRPSLMVAGFAALVLFWFFNAYLPMKQQVTGYLGEQAISLYDSPEALESTYNFIYKLVSFGDKTKLFSRMVIAGVGGSALLIWFLYHLGRRESWQKGFGKLNSGAIFIATAIIGFYGSLMIWNYRPLRYQLVLIYLFCGAAAIVMDALWRKWSEPVKEKTPILFYFITIPVVMTLVYQLYSWLAEILSLSFYYSDDWLLLLLAASVISILIALILFKYRMDAFSRIPLIGKVVVILALASVVVFSAIDYCYWAERPTYMTRDDSADLKMVLAPGAVISGPFAPQFTMETNIPSIIHMFGVSEPDPDLFKKFPITHLLVDDGNETKARQDYPDIMDSATQICTYHIGLKKARLFRIAGRTGNKRADSYRGSLFEIALADYAVDSGAAGNNVMRHFMSLNPLNISGNLLMAEKAEAADYMDEAEILFKKAVEFSPTNYDLNARLAKFYADRFEAASDPRMREGALKYFEAALKYAPTVQKIEMEYNQIKDGKVDLRGE